jgi:hypothetical protein
MSIREKKHKNMNVGYRGTLELLLKRNGKENRKFMIFDDKSLGIPD